MRKLVLAAALAATVGFVSAPAADGCTGMSQYLRGLLAGWDLPPPPTSPAAETPPARAEPVPATQGGTTTAARSGGATSSTGGSATSSPRVLPPPPPPVMQRTGVSSLKVEEGAAPAPRMVPSSPQVEEKLILS